MCLRRHCRGKMEGKSHMLPEQKNLLHTVWEHCPKTSEGTEEAEHASYNSDFNETIVISGTEITIDLISTEKVKMQLPTQSLCPSPFRTMT